MNRPKTEAAIVKAFRVACGSYVSGESLASGIGVSRAAIWKHINAMRKKGYEIEATPKLGYRLMSAPDSLHAEQIVSLLTTRIIGKEIVHFDIAGSTNDEAKVLALKGVREGTVVIAEQQTNGKGRLERFWVSPKGGVWLSVVLRPRIIPMVASRLPIMSAVVVAKTIELMGINPEIKWPNDIVVNGKKVCGILLELAAQPDRIDYVVVGIGVNANFELASFSDELKDFSTSLMMISGHRIDRVQLTANLLSLLEKEYDRFVAGDWDGIKGDWLKRCGMLNSLITLDTFDGEITGKFIGIDDYGALLLKSFNGEVGSYTAGDVTVKKQPMSP